MVFFPDIKCKKRQNIKFKYNEFFKKNNKIFKWGKNMGIFSKKFRKE